VSFTQDIYMHVIPGMDEHAAQLAATAILGCQRPEDDRVGVASPLGDV
jgi:hypothetical protein